MMGSSILTTPLVGMAAAVAIIAKMVISSPRVKAHLRRQRPKSRCRVNSRTKSRKKATGVADVRARAVPLMICRA